MKNPRLQPAGEDAQPNEGIRRRGDQPPLVRSVIPPPNRGVATRGGANENCGRGDGRGRGLGRGSYHGRPWRGHRHNGRGRGRPHNGDSHSNTQRNLPTQPGQAAQDYVDIGNVTNQTIFVNIHQHTNVVIQDTTIPGSTISSRWRNNHQVAPASTSSSNTSRDTPAVIGVDSSSKPSLPNSSSAFDRPPKRRKIVHNNATPNQQSSVKSSFTAEAVAPPTPINGSAECLIADPPVLPLPRFSRSPKSTIIKREHGTSPQLSSRSAVRSPLVKRERSPSLIPEHPLPVLEGCSRFVLKADCIPSHPDYRKNRNRWSCEVIDDLRTKGVIATRVLFRDDGMVVDWKSDVPVIPDTLLPSQSTQTSSSTSLERSHSRGGNTPSNLASSHIGRQASSPATPGSSAGASAANVQVSTPQTAAALASHLHRQSQRRYPPPHVEVIDVDLLGDHSATTNGSNIAAVERPEAMVRLSIPLLHPNGSPSPGSPPSGSLPAIEDHPITDEPYLSDEQAVEVIVSSKTTPIKATSMVPKNSPHPEQIENLRRIEADALDFLKRFLTTERADISSVSTSYWQNATFSMRVITTPPKSSHQAASVSEPENMSSADFVKAVLARPQQPRVASANRTAPTATTQPRQRNSGVKRGPIQFMSILLSGSSQYIFLSPKTCDGDLVYDTLVADNTNIGSHPGIGLFCHSSGKTNKESWVCTQNFVLQRKSSLEPPTAQRYNLLDHESPLVIVSHQVIVRVRPVSNPEPR